jgi:hypothetical protein
MVEAEDCFKEMRWTGHLTSLRGVERRSNPAALSWIASLRSQ